MTATGVMDLQAQLAGDLVMVQEKRRVAWMQAMKEGADQVAAQAQVQQYQTGLASASAKKKAAPPPRQVYFSAPVMKTSEKRPADEASVDESEAKRQAVVSPADLRAAAAKAAAEKPEVLVWKPDAEGYHHQVSSSIPAAKAAAPAPAPIATTADCIAASVADAPSDNGDVYGGMRAAFGTDQAGACLMPPPSGPPPGPPLPPGWVRVPHEGDFYFWNTTTSEVSWEHPSGPKAEVEKPVFKEEHRILWSDLGKVIGRQGVNLKIIKESIGCQINVPRNNKGGGKGKGKDKDKGKDGKKGKAKGPPEGAIIGAGDGSKPIGEENFVVVSITAENAHQARGGKRCLEVMLGYGKRVEAALEALGVEVKFPKMMDEISGGSGNKHKDDVDPMDPSSYSDAPQGGWSGGMKKPGERNAGGQGRAPTPMGDVDSKQANAERC